MSERIQELVRKSGGYEKDDDGEETKIAVLVGKDVEKFAELIVKECANIAWNNEDFLTEKIIKQHFGVEE